MPSAGDGLGTGDRTARPFSSLASMTAKTTGHVFISYVHENSAEVDRIERILRAAGISVWRDTTKLWPGEVWQDRIRTAITEGALVFIACVSAESVSKEKSYQREELMLAVEEYRLRNPAVPWLIPVRLSDCEMPSYSLGAGRSFDSLQRTDLFGDRWEEGSARLVAAVMRAFGRSESASGSGGLVETAPEARVKEALLDPARQIELDDYVMGVANRAAVTLVDPELFPSSSDLLRQQLEGTRFVVTQADRYWTTVETLTRVLIVGSAWGKAEHDSIWTRATERIANTAKDGGGQTALIHLRRFAVLPLLYATAISAVHRNNLGPLRAVAVDARLRHEGRTFPLIAESHIYVPFQHTEIAANVLALEAEGAEASDEVVEQLWSGRRGKRYTPVSDLLHDRLRPLFLSTIPDDDDYSETFDRVEVLLGVLAADQRQQLASQQIYAHGPWFGRFTWRDRFTEVGLEERMRAEMRSAGGGWQPVRAGMFGGKLDRAEAAFESFVEGAKRARGQRW